MLGFELAATFWHFIDILWVYLFLFLYFVRYLITYFLMVLSNIQQNCRKPDRSGSLFRVYKI